MLRTSAEELMTAGFMCSLHHVSAWALAQPGRTSQRSAVVQVAGAGRASFGLFLQTERITRSSSPGMSARRSDKGVGGVCRCASNMAMGVFCSKTRRPVSIQ